MDILYPPKHDDSQKVTVLCEGVTEAHCGVVAVLDELEDVSSTRVKKSLRAHCVKLQRKKGTGFLKKQDDMALVAKPVQEPSIPPTGRQLAANVDS